MMEKQPCQVKNLAFNRFCGVDFCPSCNVFHLKIGYTTLHIPPEAFVTVCETVNAALARFQRHKAVPDIELAMASQEAKGPLH